MLRQQIRNRPIIIDVNTQKDFLMDDGNHRVGNRRRLRLHIRRIMALARMKGYIVMSICLVHPKNSGIDFCVDGSDGARKISYTLLSNRASFAADCNTDLPSNLLREYRQIIFHSRLCDPFDEPRIERMLSEAKASEFIIIGAAAEETIEQVALGLLQRGKRVTAIVDAIGSIDKQKAKHSFRKIGAKGARLIESKRIAGISHLKGKSGEAHEAEPEEECPKVLVEQAA